MNNSPADETPICPECGKAHGCNNVGNEASNLLWEMIFRIAGGIIIIGLAAFGIIMLFELFL